MGIVRQLEEFKRAFRSNPYTFIQGAAIGFFSLLFLSLLQKLMAGYPIQPEGFIVPSIGGILFGLLMSWFFHNKNFYLKIVDESASFNKKILESVSAGALLIDPETRRIFHANRAAANMLGYRDDELSEVECIMICPHALKGCSYKQQKEKIHQAKCTLKKKDGSKITVLKTVTGIELNGKNLLLETLIDISLQEQAERTTDLFFDSSRDMLALIDKNGVIRKVNRSWKEFAIGGIHGDHIFCEVEKNFFDFFTAKSKKASSQVKKIAMETLDGVKKVIAQKIPLFEIEYPCHSLDEKKWFLIRVSHFSDDLDAILIAFIDITRQKLAQLEADKRKSQLNFIIDSAEIGTWDVMVKSGFSHYNKKWRSILGLPE